MAHVDNSTEVSLDTLSSNLQLVIDQLKDGENTRAPDPNFDLMSFWNRLGMTFKAVSTEATKLTMAFSSPPCPDAKEAEPLISGLEKSALAMLSSFYSLPVTQGQALHRKIFGTVLCVLKSTQTLVNIIKTEGHEGSKRQLQSAGGVWEYCDGFPNLPKNNRDATLEQCRQHRDLVKDALEEVQEAVDEYDEDDPDTGGGGDGDDTQWSPADLQTVTPALGLVKAALSCCKKVTLAIRDNGKCGDEVSIGQLDALCDVMARVSPAVDDVVLGLYPPLRPQTLSQESQNLVDVLLLLLDQVRTSHVSAPADEKWIDFLTKAVNHNHEKVKQRLSQ